MKVFIKYQYVKKNDAKYAYNLLVNKNLVDQKIINRDETLLFIELQNKEQATLFMLEFKKWMEFFAVKCKPLKPELMFTQHIFQKSNITDIFSKTGNHLFSNSMERELRRKSLVTQDTASTNPLNSYENSISRDSCYCDPSAPTKFTNCSISICEGSIEQIDFSPVLRKDYSSSSFFANTAALNPSISDELICQMDDMLLDKPNQVMENYIKFHEINDDYGKIGPQTSAIEMRENAKLPKYAIKNSSMNNGENKITSSSDDKNHKNCGANAIDKCTRVKQKLSSNQTKNIQNQPQTVAENNSLRIKNHEDRTNSSKEENQKNCQQNFYKNGSQIEIELPSLDKGKSMENQFEEEVLPKNLSNFSPNKPVILDHGNNFHWHNSSQNKGADKGQSNKETQTEIFTKPLQSQTKGNIAQSSKLCTEKTSNKLPGKGSINSQMRQSFSGEKRREKQSPKKIPIKLVTNERYVCPTCHEIAPFQLQPKQVMCYYCQKKQQLNEKQKNVSQLSFSVTSNNLEV